MQATIPSLSTDTAPPVASLSLLGAAALAAGCDPRDVHAYETRAASFSVKFYNPKARRGTPSVQTLVFTNKADAGTFASRHTLYGEPCVVTEVRS